MLKMADGSSPEIETAVSTKVAELRWHQLVRGRMIGSGHFGGVRAVWYDGELMALKLLPIQEKPYNTEEERERLRTECTKLAHFSHPNVRQAFGFVMEPSGSEGTTATPSWHAHTPLQRTVPMPQSMHATQVGCSAWHTTRRCATTWKTPRLPTGPMHGTVRHRYCLLCHQHPPKGPSSALRYRDRRG